MRQQLTQRMQSSWDQHLQATSRHTAVCMSNQDSDGEMLYWSKKWSVGVFDRTNVINPLSNPAYTATLTNIQTLTLQIDSL